jgi:hypothetical protein
MESAGSSEVLVPVYKNTWCHIPEDCNLTVDFLLHATLVSCSLAVVTEMTAAYRNSYTRAKLGKLGDFFSRKRPMTGRVT